MRYAEVPLALQTDRVISVDALRGFSIFWIIGADGAIWTLERMLRDKGPALSAAGSFLGVQLRHVEWEGLTFYGGLSQHWSDIRFVGVLQRIAICYLFASLLFLNVGRRGLLVALVALLGGYWALMTFVPVPGIGPGSFSRDANLADWIDARYLPGRLWDKTRDPEGLLSTLP